MTKRELIRKITQNPGWIQGLSPEQWCTLKEMWSMGHCPGCGKSGLSGLCSTCLQDAIPRAVARRLVRQEKDLRDGCLCKVLENYLENFVFDAWKELAKALQETAKNLKHRCERQELELKRDAERLLRELK